MTIIWCMVPEIWSMTDRMFCHFGPFFTVFPFYHKWQSYDIWFLRYGTWQPEFFVILGHFLPFYPSNNPENHYFEKIKKTPWDIIILQMSSINDNHMMYGLWDMQCDNQKFFAISGHFLPYYQFLKKWKKKPGDIIILHMYTLNHNHMMYSSWDMECNTIFFCHFGLFFMLLHT